MRRGPGRAGGGGASSPWLPGLAIVGAAGLVLVVALLARERSAERAAAEARASAPFAPEPDGDAPGEGEPALDPALVHLVERARAPDAGIGVLDAAAHGLLVRELFEEAEPLVERALAAAPGDAEAAIHEAVLQGVAGELPEARAGLERLSSGPAGWEASLFAAGFALRAGDEAGALRAMRRFRAQAPPGELTPALEAELQRLERRAESAAAENQSQK
ncbi:MAG TPA: hypothetical protein VEJ89_16765 [Myxococcaceae bacterium]|jgi:hypothetical protein|nr:hypothetical protein [Myxococcaceae bacterium]